ncbi:MAG TPA: hypothetical protein VGW75_08155 [Solirubrobacteraceae bacterium]|jgi:hypothetical protein|nr:hypothetical protein [Solirubrobacteraceae bacterium]
MRRSRPRLAPPSSPAPIDVLAPDGELVDVRELAREVCRRYREEFPDERERYGDAGVAWCVHDNQHLLSWALLDVRGATRLEDQVAWLARVLGARDFPLDRLARDLELCADVVTGTGREWAAEVAGRLRAATSAATGK